MSDTSSSKPAAPTEGLVEELRLKLNRETSKIGWDELQRFYAKGMVIGVAKGMDLIDVACEVSKDNKAAVEQWLSTGRIFHVDDEIAVDWHDRGIGFWAVVIAPWVLVQEIEPKEDA